ncbi:helix-turn-helix transcriptional regulator [Actinosynnema sp. NPDC023587]|uniref:helix-turn-helix domain-containing protein n=1 Tax=Actinosynnema sp. NPDC023587 TaxID=3154695 RepID=UPI003405CD15
MSSEVHEIPRFDPAALARCRRRADLTQLALAGRLTVHDNKIYRWEKGITPITAAELRRVARELRVVPPQLQLPLTAPPTMVDLRSLAALAPTELAARLHIKLHRLLLWEHGHLGGPDEHGPLLAAFIGISESAVDQHERTGLLPIALAVRLARALRVTPRLVAMAFDASRMADQNTHLAA